ncbi:hypothetical protein J1605_000589 [Eschrichtius robustus]|uniref:Uncharacterized protein n=1 Tax=Eschrichtius robustus TaxID=9764 RepID=A0AB34GVV4_ESCRO|nr:hypothetical protein J1605_000589 [Eschrichtius robustus]
MGLVSKGRSCCFVRKQFAEAAKPESRQGRPSLKCREQPEPGSKPVSQGRGAPRGPREPQHGHRTEAPRPQPRLTVTPRRRVASVCAHVLRPPFRPRSRAPIGPQSGRGVPIKGARDGRARSREANRFCGGWGRQRHFLPGVWERRRAYSAVDMEPEPVTLLVKSPNQRHRDLELSGDRSWSVSRLKAHLSRVYPERPAAIVPRS